jgi:hypothetical protein
MDLKYVGLRIPNNRTGSSSRVGVAHFDPAAGRRRGHRDQDQRASFRATGAPPATGGEFELVFKNLIERLFVERMDQNEDIFVRFE